MGQSALEEFTSYLTQALQDPPDPNAPLPLSNRHTTIYGVTVTFQVSDDASVSNVSSD
jgi:hypothetical protein